MDDRTRDTKTDQRLIEHGFPCHQVGAETQRERDTGKAPPVNRLHVWWARRPLTPSRAAIVASLSPADTDPELFVRQLGIERVQAMVNGEPWTLTSDLLARVMRAEDSSDYLEVNEKVLKALQDEQDRRAENRQLITAMKAKDVTLASDPVLQRWEAESRPLPDPVPRIGERLSVRRVMGDPAWAKELIGFTKTKGIRFLGDAYGYERAFTNTTVWKPSGLTIMDPTAGGGSIPFEALRLGHSVIANELNPVATTILYATLDYPTSFGKKLSADIEKWGKRLLGYVESELSPFHPNGHFLPSAEQEMLRKIVRTCPEVFLDFNKEHIVDYIFARQATCPHCGGEAPLLNTMWLSKEAGDPWGVRVTTDGKPHNGKVRFETYRVTKGHGPSGENPDEATVNRGIGKCVHCKQAIDGEEIKRQARGESEHGKWTDRLYAVVAIYLEPKLDKDGKPQRYTSGERAGEIKTRKVRFFRPPNQRDLDALVEAERRLQEKWPAWEAEGLIPMEKLPEGQKTSEPLRYGMPRWCDLFTPRQLLGHLYLVESLNRLKPQILSELGEDKGRAVVTYLQFAIDKGVDYNSRQTRWIPQRGIVSGTFGRHDLSLKWTFGEMIFTGPNSGAAWSLSQVIDSYQGIAELLEPVYGQSQKTNKPSITILNGTAAYMAQVEDQSVDLVCMDPPYYDNVQYGELSDYYYVWQRRTLKDLYPEVFSRRLVNKTIEAVANPVRDGGPKGAQAVYERTMRDIFRECRRVLKNDGIMTLMFTHKSQEAWEALTQSLIESGWDITASFPVESEFGASMHQKDMAAAASSIFIACRKRLQESEFPASWTGLGGTGVQHQIREAVIQGLQEFEPLRLNPVDEMVASYGRALHVLSENWPVMDGDEQVSPVRAMNEASRVVAENQIQRITGGRLKVDDLDPETAMALTLYGIYGLYEFAYDEVLNLSRSLNIALIGKPGGYRLEPGQRFIGINQEITSERSHARRRTEDQGYAAPLVRKGSRLRLARPNERDPRRLEHPQTDWDILHGLLLAYSQGDLPVARQYLERHASDRSARLIDLLEVWAREMDDEALRREAEALLFSLKPRR
jgi:adenine-specific DNA methylase